MAGAEQKKINVKIKGVNDLLKLKAELKKLKKEQAAVTEVNKKSEKEWIDKERAIDKATKKIRQHRNELTKLDKDQQKSGKSAAGFGKNMVKAAAAITAVVAAFRVLSRVFVSAFKTFTEFEFSMAKVKAISGATNEEFMKLTESAKELGRTTFFTAKEVAELQVNFSKLGFTAEQILNLQAATLDLAMATGSDLARSAMVAGSAVRGFGLDAEEATRVVDVMAVSFTSSALDIEKWQTSMTKVSAIAASIGVDIEGTAAVMGALSDTGIEASIAGTSLRNIFLKMANPTSTLAKRIGFTVNSTEDMVKALKKLKDAQIGQLEMQTLVDKRQVIAMQAMIEQVEKIEMFTGALNNASGAGREMAKIMEDSTKGAFKRFQSALEGLFLVLSEKIAPWVNKVTKGTREWIEWLTKSSDIKISQRMQAQVKEFQNLFNVIKRTTATEKTRQLALSEMNRKYSEYLGYQLTDINDTKALTKAEKLLNDQFEERIRLQAAEEGYTEFLAQQEARMFRLFELEKKIGKLKAPPISLEDALKGVATKGAERSVNASIKFFDFISDWDFEKNGGDIKGFMQHLEAGAVFAGGAVGQLVTTTHELFKDMDDFSEWSMVLDEIMKLKAETAEEGEKEVYWTKRLKELDSDILKIRKGGTKPTPCPDGQHRDPITGECVDLNKVRDFAEELASYINSVSDKKSEEFVANEEKRNILVLQKKRDLLEDEYKLLADGDKRKAAAYLKYLKAVETADKAVLKRKERKMDEALVNTKRRLAEEGRNKEHFTLELERKELQAEKRMLQKKLQLYKDYSEEWLKIRKKMEQVDEELKVNTHESDMELKQFKVELAQEIANATFAIMANNLAREKEAAMNHLQDTYDNEMYYLDIQLRDKQMTQAQYDGLKLKKDTELKEKEEQLAKEFARKEKNAARAQAIINGALAITKVYSQLGTLATFTVPMIIAATMAQLAVIESQQFAKGGMIEEYANGGMVMGRSHAQGGEKFAVGGRVVELEGGEAVINKRSTAMFKNQLSAMNAAGGGVKFADGGLMNSSSFTSARFNSSGFNQAGGTSKVVVVESDITNSQNKVKAIQSNASF